MLGLMYDSLVLRLLTQASFLLEESTKKITCLMKLT